MKKLAAIIMSIAVFASAAAHADYSPPFVPREYNGSPYFIAVNRTLNEVTVYTADDEGFYTVPDRAFVCSTGRPGHRTPLGYNQTSALKLDWLGMVDGTYGQYVTQFRGNYLFHSVCYSAPSKDALIDEEYNDLGRHASRGCVRLQTEDAKWIYDNVPTGTGVLIFDSYEPGPLQNEEKAMNSIPPELSNGWDPTDPDEANPWKSILAAPEGGKLVLPRDSVRPVPGMSSMPCARYSSSDESVVTVTSGGVMKAKGAGKATITITSGGNSALLEVTVPLLKAAVLHFDALHPMG